MTLKHLKLTGNVTQFHRSVANLTVYQKEAYHDGENCTTNSASKSNVLPTVNNLK
jgi:hypothetical protein